jgi:pimeloyl-ACP methyl ester carboxylesterase
VLSFDVPGMGGSETPRTPLRLHGLAMLIGDLIVELGYERVDVLGHSLGGMIALELAYRSPERVDRLVLCNTAPGLPTIPGVNPIAWSVIATPLRTTRLVTSAAGGRTSRDPRFAAKVKGTAADRPSWAELWRQLYAALGWSSWPWLHCVEHPTLVVAGGGDPLIPAVNSRLIAWRMPNATLEIVSDGGHLLSVDQPEVLSRLITDFAPLAT